MFAAFFPQANAKAGAKFPVMKRCGATIVDVRTRSADLVSK